MKVQLTKVILWVYEEYEKGEVEADIDPRIWIDYQEALKKLKKIQSKMEEKSGIK